MTITNITVSLGSEEYVVAYVDVEFDGSFLAKGMRVVKRPGGSWLLSMPAKKTSNGRFVDIYHPTTKQSRSYLEREVFEKVLSELNETAPTAGVPA